MCLLRGVVWDPNPNTKKEGLKEGEMLTGPDLDEDVGLMERTQLTGPDVNGDAELAHQLMTLDATGNTNEEDLVREMEKATRHFQL
jgi:hypothetical protein